MDWTLQHRLPFKIPWCHCQNQHRLRTDMTLKQWKNQCIRCPFSRSSVWPHQAVCVSSLFLHPAACYPQSAQKLTYPVTFSQVMLRSLHWLALAHIICVCKHFSTGKLLNVTGSLKNQKTMSIIIQVLITLRWGKWFIPNFANMAKHENKNWNNPEKSTNEAM